jgi:exopolysaccharide biosynthesis polyprenyl glycosylphosphotransferase
VAYQPTEALPQAPSSARLSFRVPLTISERKVLLVAGDVLAMLLTLGGVLRWRLDEPSALDALRSHPIWFVVLTLVWSGWATLFGVYDLTRAADIRSSLRAIIRSAIITSLTYVGIPFVTPELHHSRLTAAAFVATSPIAVALWRLTYVAILARPAFRRRVGIIGTNGAGRAIAQVLRQFGRAEYELVGFISVNGGGGAGKTAVDGPVLGEAGELADLANRWRLAELILAHTPSEEGADLIRGILGCQELGVQMTSVVGVFERLMGKVPLARAGGNLQSVLPLDRTRGPSYLLVKRALDIIVGMVGAALALLIAPLVMLTLRLESRGPLFYRQVRVGRHGHPFLLFKFRTMRPDAEADGPRWAAVDDPRVTRSGRWLRRLHLDELPQAFNILRGDMSLVGPRPERPEFVERLEETIPFYRARHAVRPGLTGWAQVNFGYASSPEDSLVKLQFDLYYLKHMSLLLDLFIALQTLGLLLGLGQSSPGTSATDEEAAALVSA